MKFIIREKVFREYRDILIEFMFLNFEDLFFKVLKDFGVVIVDLSVIIKIVVNWVYVDWVMFVYSSFYKKDLGVLVVVG